jgi:transcriptional regulator with XRE-family HTH domain
MTFAEEFSRLIQINQISIPELAQNIGISPSTPYFWIKGRSVPGKKTLDRISEVLNLDEKTKKLLWDLRDSHQADNKPKKKDEKAISEFGLKFAHLFSEIMNNRSISMYELSDLSGVRRATIYSWMKAQVIPKADKLESVLKFIDCNVDFKDELIGLSLKARESNPRPKGYKNRSLWEKDAIERTSIFFSEIGLKVTQVTSLDYDLEIRPKVSLSKSQYVPVFFKNKTADLNSIFVKGCELKMKARSDFVLIIIFDNNPNHNRALFEYYGIFMVTEKAFHESAQSILSGLFPNN